MRMFEGLMRGCGRMCKEIIRTEFKERERRTWIIRGAIEGKAIIRTRRLSKDEDEGRSTQERSGIT